MGALARLNFCSAMWSPLNKEDSREPVWFPELSSDRHPRLARFHLRGNPSWWSFRAFSSRRPFAPEVPNSNRLVGTGLGLPFASVRNHMTFLTRDHALNGVIAKVEIYRPLQFAADRLHAAGVTRTAFSLKNAVMAATSFGCRRPRNRPAFFRTARRRGSVLAPELKPLPQLRDT